MRAGRPGAGAEAGQAETADGRLGKGSGRGALGPRRGRAGARGQVGGPDHLLRSQALSQSNLVTNMIQPVCFQGRVASRVASGRTRAVEAAPRPRIPKEVSRAPMTHPGHKGRPSLPQRSSPPPAGCPARLSGCTWSANQPQFRSYIRGLGKVPVTGSDGPCRLRSAGQGRGQFATTGGEPDQQLLISHPRPCQRSGYQAARPIAWD